MNGNYFNYEIPAMHQLFGFRCVFHIKTFSISNQIIILPLAQYPDGHAVQDDEEAAPETDPRSTTLSR